jgi:hypothetical protein
VANASQKTSVSVMLVDPWQRPAGTMHSEYPSRHVDAFGRTRLLFSEFGPDRRWRLKDATLASDGAPVERVDDLAMEAPLPFAGNAAFPHVTTWRGRWYLVFSAANGPEDTYDGLYLSSSADGSTWSRPERIHSGNGLDPMLFAPEHEDGPFAVFFTVSAPERGFNAIVGIEGRPGGTWTEPRPLLTPSFPGDGMYTIAGSRMAGRKVFAVERSQDVELYCIEGGEMVRMLAQPLLTNAPGTARNSIRYGFWLPPEVSPGQEVAVLSNGIQAYGAESGGAVFAGTLSIPDIVDPTSCE